MLARDSGAGITNTAGLASALSRGPDPSAQISAAHTWCGGALAENAARQVQKWRNFVQMVPRSR